MMYKKISAILFPLLAVVLVGTIIWANQVNARKNEIAIKAENQYQRAFHDLTYHIEHLHMELGNALAVNSTSQGFHRKCLINAWQLTSEAQASINQLPLAWLPFDKTEQLLSKISKFSYQTAVRDLDKEPLSKKEMETLRTLVDQSHQISTELNNIQSLVIAQNLSWLDVELASDGGNEPSDNSIVDGLKTVNQTVSEYTEAGWGPSIMSMFDDTKLKKLSGKSFSEQEIRQKAAKFLGITDEQHLNVKLNGQQSDFEIYRVSLDKQQGDNNTVRIDYTKQGGHLLSMMDERLVKENNITSEQALEHAKQFLKQHGYGDTLPINYNEYDNVTYLTLAVVQDDIIMYPKKLAVYVAMDNGDITGFQAADYLSDHKVREITPAELSLEEAKKKLNPEFKVSDHRLAIIENDLNKDVLCYQFIGSIHDQKYRIFINAETGLEEKLEQLT